MSLPWVLFCGTAGFVVGVLFTMALYSLSAVLHA